MPDEIRELFRAEASAIAPPQPDANAVKSAGRRRLRWRRLAAASIVAAAVAGAAGTMQLVGERHAPASENAKLTVLARVPLATSWAEGPRGAGDLAFGLGKVWTLQGEEPTLQRIDPATNAVEEVLTLGDGRNGNFWHVEVGFGRLWLTDPDKDEVIARDPATGDVVGRIEGVSLPMDVVASGDHLWVRSADGRGELNEELHRVDPRTLQVTGSVSTGTECCIAGLVEHAGYLWMARSEVADTPRNPGADHDDLVFDLKNELMKVDPDALEVVERIPLPGDTYRPGDTILGDVAAAAGYLWVAHVDDALVDRVDPRDGAVESVDLDGVLRPGALSFADGVLWAWEINGSLVAPIDPDALEVGRASDLGEDVSGWPVEGAGSFWTAVQPGDGDRDHLLRVGPPEAADSMERTPPPPPDPTPPPHGDFAEHMSEKEQAQIFAFRALAETGLMEPFSRRSYLFTSAEDTTQVGDAWRIAFAASDCEPRDNTFTCNAISGDEMPNGNPRPDTFVTVELDGRWIVTGVEGNMPEAERRRVVGYDAAPIAGPSRWEFPATEVWPTGHGFMIEMIYLWIGPYPTEAPGSVCEMTMLDAAGRPVGEPERFYEEPPNRAFEHAGGVRALDLEGVEGDIADVTVDCYQARSYP